jgi:hypothetical protein
MDWLNFVKWCWQRFDLWEKFTFVSIISNISLNLMAMLDNSILMYNIAHYILLFWITVSFLSATYFWGFKRAYDSYQTEKQTMMEKIKKS